MARRRLPRQPEPLELPAFAAVALTSRLSCSRFAGGADDTDNRPVTVAGLAVPWNTVVQLNWWGDTVEFSPGSLVVEHPGRVPFLLDHTDHPMGYGVSFTETDDGLEAVVEVPRDELVDEATARAVRQMSNGVRTALSIGAVIRDAERLDKGDHDHYRVTGADLVELSSVVVPRFDDARIASIAASAYRRNGVSTMPMSAASTEGLPPFPRREALPVTLDDDVDPPDDDDTDDDDDDGSASSSTSTNSRRLSSTHPTRRAGAAVVPYQTRRGAGRDTSLGAVSRRLAATGGDPRMVRAALADVLTTDVPGLVRPQYVDELLGLLRLETPAINAFRQGNLTSNPIVFPKWTTLPTVDKVTGGPPAEKVEIPSGPAVIGSMSLNVDTYAGGNDVSVQVIDWSSPDFIEAYFQACAEVYGRKIEAAFEAGLVTWATALTPAVGAGFIDVIGQVLSAVAGKGLPGSLVLLISGDLAGPLFVELANSGSAGLLGALNADLPSMPRIVVGPHLAAGTIVGGTTGSAISFQNAGAPIRLRAVDVSLLGLDLGVYGYFAAGALYAAGLVKVGPAFVPAGAKTFDVPSIGLDVGGDLLHDTPPAAPAAKSTKSA